MQAAGRSNPAMKAPRYQQPAAPYRAPRRPQHPLPFGLRLVNELMEWNRYERLRTILRRLYQYGYVTMAENRLLEETFGRPVAPQEAAELLNWVEREMRLF